MFVADLFLTLGRRSQGKPKYPRLLLQLRHMGPEGSTMRRNCFLTLMAALTVFG
jgi:hypothetical protein